MNELNQVNSANLFLILRRYLEKEKILLVEEKEREDNPVIEKYKLPPIQIFDKNCPLKRVNQKFAIFRQNVRKLELFW